MAEIPNAVEWARTVEPERMRLADLDAHLLRFDPDALHALGRRRLDDRGGPTKRAQRASGAARTRRAPWRGLLALVAGLLVLAAPIAGWAAVVADGVVRLPGSSPRFLLAEPMDVERAFPIAAVCFAISVVLAVVPLVLWLRRGRLRQGMLVAVPLGVAVSAGLAIPQIQRRAAEGGDPGPALVAAVAAAIAGTVVGLAVLLGSARRVRVWFPTTGAPDVAAAARAIGVLPEGAQQGLRDERSEALGVLAERGLVDAALLERADAAPLGSLVRLDAVARPE